MTFSLILFAVLVAGLLTLFYLLGILVRHFGAWLMRTEPPGERVGTIAVMIAAIGAIAGGMLHNPAYEWMNCEASGQNLIACAIDKSS